MAWSGLIRRWDSEQGRSKTLTLRIEDTQEPGCLMKLYDGEIAIGEELEASSEQAVAKLIQVAKRYLNDPSIDETSLYWVQL